jgi:hypothetical protein
VAEEGREGVGRLVARAHQRGGPEHQLSRDACSVPLCLRLPRGMGWAAGWLRFCADRSRAHGGRGWITARTRWLGSVRCRCLLVHLNRAARHGPMARGLVPSRPVRPPLAPAGKCAAQKQKNPH